MLEIRREEGGRGAAKVEVKVEVGACAAWLGSTMTRAKNVRKRPCRAPESDIMACRRRKRVLYSEG